MATVPAGLAASLSAWGLRLETRTLDLHAPDAGALDAVLVDAERIDATPEHVAQRVRTWNAGCLVALAGRFDARRARVWRALGAADFLGVADVERLALVLAEAGGPRPARSSDLLQTVIDAVPAPIFFKDARGVYLGCNQAFERYIGVSPRDIVGLTVYDVAPRDLAEVYFAADRSLLESRGQQIYEAQVKFKDGSVRDVVFHKATFLRADGSLGGLVGAMLDITERKRLESRLAELATLDPLTSLHNRRSFLALSERELSRCRREAKPLCLMVIDADHFKGINDRFGHAAGDAALVSMARTMTDALRRHDVLARAGGEEFYATLGDTTLDDAQEIARRLCIALATRAVPHDGREITVTASIGVAACATASETLESALQRADQAMYEAKRLGRNRVVIAG